MKLIYGQTGEGTTLQSNDKMRITLQQNNFIIRLYRGKKYLFPSNKAKCWIISGNIDIDSAYVLANLIADISGLDVTKIEQSDREIYFLFYEN